MAVALRHHQHMLHAPDDAEVRLVAEGLVKLLGTAGAADELDRLYGRGRAVEALSRTARLGELSLSDDVEVILDLTDVDEVDLADARPAPVEIDLRDAHALGEGRHPTLRAHRSDRVTARPYWL